MTYLDTLIEHYARWLGTPGALESPKERRRREMPGDYRVLVARPRGWGGKHFYLTCGMSRPDDERKLELFLIANTYDQSLVDLLSAVAAFHIHGERLGLEHTVDFGEPWLPGSKCTCGYISWPYLLGGSPFAKMKSEHGTTYVLCLIPITPEERRVKIESGAEALELLFDEGKVDLADPLRDSLAGLGNLARPLDQTGPMLAGIARSYQDALIRHYSVHLGNRGELVRLKDGRQLGLPEDFGVVIVKPARLAFRFFHLTCGMSREDETEKLELYFVSGNHEVGLVDLLGALALGHLQGGRLGPGMIVDLGGPYLPGSTCTHGFLSRAFVPEDGIGELESKYGTTRVLEVVPITPEEARVGRESGPEALEKLLKEGGIKQLDPLRRSVV
ncbi:MAG TPA: suppressor of fused domain protein [Myxococcota bacterium]|nr:suppressor of fused domain protein [Myxococcota bacterium]HRY94938.1 suppressor of fused domain protein [Myxococcota bacterium]